MPATPIYALPYPAAADPADVPLDMQELAERIEAVLGAVPAASLPASPTNGQVAYLDCGNGVIWQFRYNAASGSSFKWEFVGGPPMFAEVTTDQGTASASYVDLATAGPSITVPRAGDYDVEIGCGYYAATNGAPNAYMSYALGATAAVDADGLYVNPTTGLFVIGGASRTRRKTGLAAATAVVAKYKSNGAIDFHFRDRWMKVSPVRVS